MESIISNKAFEELESWVGQIVYQVHLSGSGLTVTCSSCNGNKCKDCFGIGEVDDPIYFSDFSPREVLGLNIVVNKGKSTVLLRLDGVSELVSEHLVFEFEEDAIAYCKTINDNFKFNLGK